MAIIVDLPADGRRTSSRSGSASSCSPTVPAVLLGVAVALLVTGTTLNVQSFMGAIMAIGVSVANAILLVTFAEQERREGLDADAAANRRRREPHAPDPDDLASR